MSTLDAAGWRTVLGLAAEEDPALLVLEGTWWEDAARAARLPLLSAVRPLAVPRLHLGTAPSGALVVYGCAYGAPAAVEPVHLLAQVARPIVVQIGSCGGLQAHVHTGDAIVTDGAVAEEGASVHYGGDGRPVAPDGGVAAALAAALAEAGVPVHRGPLVTTEVLLRQPATLVERWRAAGHLGVDMETSAVLTAARHFGLAAASALFVWDELDRGRSWLDPFPPDEAAAQDRARLALFDAALGLV